MGNSQTNTNEYQPLKLTLEDGRRALGVHVLEKGHQLHEKYGTFVGFDTLQKILQDVEFVRYPTRIEFDSTQLEEGMFACAMRVTESNASDGYVIYVHEMFKENEGDLAAIVLYHLVTVNYGEFATHNEAEEFGSAALGLDKEYYYDYLCRIADKIS